MFYGAYFAIDNHKARFIAVSLGYSAKSSLGRLKLKLDNSLFVSKAFKGANIRFFKGVVKRFPNYLSVFLFFYNLGGAKAMTGRIKCAWV
ncbi:Uncharacterised protein [Capnocytophaga granulosa]|nr:Uncharacterised protein [Capnocytophaga granulosa]